MDQEPPQDKPIQEPPKKGIKSKSLKNTLIVLLLLSCGGLGYFFSSLFGVQVWMLAAGKTTSEKVVTMVKSAPDYKFDVRIWKALVFVVLKEERRLEVWGVPRRGKEKKLLKQYPIKSMSGTYGPKLSASDQQVPEGTYRVNNLNPNNFLRRSIRLNYPNSFDISRAYADGRKDIVTDFMIHGGTTSASSVAIGDKAIDELFTMSYEIGMGNITVILAPFDMRVWRYRLGDVGGMLMDGQGALLDNPNINWELDFYTELQKEIDRQFGPKEEGAEASLVPGEPVQASEDFLGHPPLDIR